MIIDVTFRQRLSVYEVRSRVRVVWLTISLRPMILHLFFAKTYQELYISVDVDEVEMSVVRNGIYLAVSSFGLTVIVLLARKTLSKLLIG